MGKGIFKRLVSGIVTGLLCLTSVPSGIGLSSRAADDYQQTGTLDGYDYEVWNQYSQGTISFTPGNAGTYSCSWSGIHNILFRSGKKWSNNPQWDTLDGIQLDYECDYKPNGNSYLCVYGWTQNPLVEYYIVESYGSWRPPGTSSTMAMVGTITVDGGTYEVYKGTHDGPSIESGVTHFNQYWSVRVDSQLRTSGTIDVSKHFKAWEDQFGMDMGGLHEVALNVEGWQSSGSANVTKNALTVGGGMTDDPDPVDVEPDENGYYFFDDFEDGNGLWGKRGSTTLTADTENYYSAGQSVLVSDRTDTWQGIGRSLDPTVFVPGKTYSFGTGVLQTNGETQTMKLTLEYKDSSGEAQYKTIASADAESGVWTKLENTAFTIPSDASSMLIYVESDTTDPFYVDDAFGGVEGTKSTVTTGGGTVKGAAEPTTSVPTARTWGDANNDGEVTVADATLIMQYLATSDSSVFKDEEGKLNADVNNCGDGITANDALSIQKYLAGAISELPESYSPDYVEQKTTTTTTKAPAVTTTAAGGVDISWIDPNKPMVAISFDDGAVGTSPSASSMRIINAIADSGFHATFFYVGSWTNTTDKENEVKYAYSKGMEIANHTTTHPYLTNLSDSEIRSEYDTTASKLKGIIGAEPSPLLRLPYLAYNDTVTRVLSDVPMITCKVDSADWNNATKDQIISKITTAMQDGSLDNSIVLCHETYDTTAEAMEYLAPYLKSQGWQIVTVSEMFAVNGKTLEGGKVYSACY